MSKRKDPDQTLITGTPISAGGKKTEKKNKTKKTLVVPSVYYVFLLGSFFHCSFLFLFAFRFPFSFRATERPTNSVLYYRKKDSLKKRFIVYRSRIGLISILTQLMT